MTTGWGRIGRLVGLVWEAGASADDPLFPHFVRLPVEHGAELARYQFDGPEVRQVEGAGRATPRPVRVARTTPMGYLGSHADRC